MAVENLQGKNIITGMLAQPWSKADPGLASGRVSTWVETVEVTAGASATSTYHMARLPSSARIFGDSKLHFDGITPTDVDLGIFAVNSGDVTDDPDAILAAVSMAAAGSADVVSDIANYGKALWELAGLAEDPNCMLDLKVTINGTATAGGTLTLDLRFATQ